MKPLDLIKTFALEAGTYGACAQPWQLAFFEAIFAVQADGRPVFRLAYDERRRGESKTEDMAAAALADLMTGPPRHRSYAVAADQDQAGLILDSVRGFVSRSAVLAGLEVGKNLVRNPATDSELRVMSSDDRTAYGIRARKVFFDELSLQTDKRLWLAMWTAIGKNPRSQMIAVSMAGFDFTSVGWEVRELASKTEGYYFHTREGSELAPWLSERDMVEQQATLHPSDYARFWECRWVEAAGTWVTREMYEAAEVGTEALAGDPGFTYYGAVDLGLVHDATAIAVVHVDGDRVVLDSLATLQGSRSDPVELAAVEDLVVDLTQRFGVSKWTFESPQAIASVQRLQQRLGSHRVTARWPTVETQGRLFGTLYSLFANHRLVVFPHEQLKREALNLVTRVMGGRIKVVDSSAIHQDHVVAVGIAAELATSKRPSLTVAPVLMYSPSTWLGEGQANDDHAVASGSRSFANAVAAPTSLVPTGAKCASIDRDGFVCGSERFKESGECIRCGKFLPGASTSGPGAPHAVLLTKSNARW